MTFTYKHTAYACHAAFVSQAVVNMLAPLLFTTFQNQFGLTLEQVGRLILVNFGTQLLTDILAVPYVDRIGYRAAAVIGNAFCGGGLITLSILPNILSDSYTGLCIAVAAYAVGGGLLEVVINPIITYIPGAGKTGTIALLNASYSWGQVLVIGLSSIFLWIFGTDCWQILPVVWAMLPLGNMFLFFKVPIVEPQKEQRMMSLKELLDCRGFLIAMLLMFCTGAAVLSMSQWSSFFAEQGLKVPKLMGDLLGPCLFSGLAGTGRTLYGIYGKRLNLPRTLLVCAVLCILCYLTAIFAPWPILSLAGCALCGFVTCLMWPGTVAMSAERFCRGGTVMFGLLAIFGDLGGSVGPWLTGVMSDWAEQLPVIADIAVQRGESLEQMALKMGLLVAVMFPVILFVGMILFKKDSSETGR